MLKKTRVITALAAAVPLAATALLGAPAAQANTQLATVSVLHAIPAGLGADVVDVYAGDALLIDDFKPGTLQTLRVPGGTYDLAVFADGVTPETGTPVLEARNTRVPAGANATVTANLNASGQPALNVFVNNTTKVKKGNGRLTVRHIAAAPAVDVRVNKNVLFKNLRNPKQRVAQAPIGTYNADVVLAGTKTVAIGPAKVTLKRNINTIVYAWGSAADGTLQLAVQEVRTKR
jgi:hypothetical protein